MGIEPTTYDLRNRCSTPELQWPRGSRYRPYPLGMEPPVGIEPTTDGLQNRCSTAELQWPHQLEQDTRVSYCVLDHGYELLSAEVTARIRSLP